MSDGADGTRNQGDGRRGDGRAPGRTASGTTHRSGRVRADGRGRAGGHGPRSLAAWLDRGFQERQVIVRTGHGVRTLRLGRGRQMAMAGAALGVLAWGLAGTAATVGTLFHIDDQATQIRDLEIGYAQLITDVADRRGELAPISARMEADRTVTERILERSATLQRRSDRLADRVDRLERAKASLEADRAALRDTIASLEADLTAMAAARDAAVGRVAALETRLSDAEADRQRADVTARDLRGEIDRLRQALDEAETWREAADRQIAELTRSVQGAYGTVDRVAGERDRLSGELSETRHSLAEAEDEIDRLEALNRRMHLAAVDMATARDRLSDRAGRLEGRIGSLQAEIVAMERGQEAFFETLRARAESHAEDLESGLSLTGLDVDALVRELESETHAALKPLAPGRGGPMIPAAAVATDMAEVPEEAVDLIALVDRLTELQEVAVRLPLSPPIMGDWYITSRYGGRRDPLTGRSAAHHGLDFGAGWREAVVAAAPGEIVHAGRRGAYGNLVEIDHGLGVTTRYAHLHSVDVSVGDTVEAGDPVGVLGNTGRSTGPHLHYEVRLDDRPIDPMNFVKAGEHVLEGNGPR
ncbi:MAG: peptidoglycan DD-metalloendopeptidase family protein [Azospirillaceae bacterium]